MAHSLNLVEISKSPGRMRFAQRTATEKCQKEKPKIGNHGCYFSPNGSVRGVRYRKDESFIKNKLDLRIFATTQPMLPDRSTSRLHNENKKYVTKFLRHSPESNFTFIRKSMGQELGIPIKWLFGNTSFCF